MLADNYKYDEGTTIRPIFLYAILERNENWNINYILKGK